MYKILSKQILGPNVKQIEVEAPDIAKRAKPGQFVVLRVDENGERIPLTIADKNPEKGTITIIFQEAGKSTSLLGSLNESENILDVVGPLGNPTKIEKSGTIAAIGGGVGVAEILPVIKALKEAGNKVISIVGARTKGLLILTEQLKAAADELLITTDDGSSGTKGFVTTVLSDLLVKKVQIDEVYAIGPVPMMKAVSELTKKCGIKTTVSLNPIMVDGTGMCGACRVSIDGKTYFACVHGPEFNGHLVNWDELSSRLALFKNEEKISLGKFNCSCHDR
jgi:NAD(P)H-flavin reductase